MSLFGKKKKAIVNYIDLDNDKNNIATSGELLGNVGEEIGYSSSDQIDALNLILILELVKVIYKKWVRKLSIMKVLLLEHQKIM